MKELVRSPRFLFLFLFIIVIVWVVGFLYTLPFRYWWFSALLHFFGGMWTAFLIVWLLIKNAVGFYGNSFSQKMLLFSAIVGGVMFISVDWEFAEFIFDRYIIATRFTFLQGALEDTLRDLLFDMIGGSVGFVFYWFTATRENFSSDASHA